MPDHLAVSRAVAVTGARGALGTALLPLLADLVVRAIDRRDGVELEDRDALARALAGCDAVVHLAALHPLVAPRGADVRTYERANVAPFAALLEVAHAARVRRVVLASSTSVWIDAPPGEPAAFYESDQAANSEEPYALSKRECEDMLRGSGLEGVVLRLARFARPGSDEDEVRKLYRAVDTRDAALAVRLALDRAASGAVFSVSAPTPFRPEDAAQLARDPAAAIRLRTGHAAPWTPARIGSVVTSDRARDVLGWHARHPSALLTRNC